MPGWPVVAMPPDEAERRPRREGGAQDGHGGGNVNATIPPPAVKGPRCKFLHPSHLTGCRELAEPGSQFCTRHQGGGR
jgi:hypothetical protein